MAIRISEAVQRLPRRVLEQFDSEFDRGMTSNTTHVIKQLNGTLLSQENELMHLCTAVKDLRAELAQLRDQKPVAYGWLIHDGVYDTICPDEHARHEGKYTVQLYAAPGANL